MPAAARDACQLVEERDHVVQRDEIEGAVRVGQRGRVTDVVALAAEPARLPYPDASFDVVALNNMIPFFDELARVARGHVAIAFSMGDQTPIYVPLDRVRRELEARGFVHVGDFGVALLARKA